MGQCPIHCHAPCNDAPCLQHERFSRAFFRMLSGQIIRTGSAAPISERCLFSCRGYNEHIVRSILHCNPTGGDHRCSRKETEATRRSASQNRHQGTSASPIISDAVLRADGVTVRPPNMRAISSRRDEGVNRVMRVTVRFFSTALLIKK